MILHEGRVGNANFVFSADASLRARVVLPAPVSKARILLRGFDVAYDGEDRHLKHLRVQLDLGFGDRPDEVEVIAQVHLADKSPVGELISFEVAYTILAT